MHCGLRKKFHPPNPSDPVFLNSRSTLFKSSALATENSSFQDHVSITNFYKRSETKLTSLICVASAFTLREWGLWLKRRRSWDSIMMARGKDLGYCPRIFYLHTFIDSGTWVSYSVTNLVTKCHSLWVGESFRVLETVMDHNGSEEESNEGLVTEVWADWEPIKGIEAPRD